MAFVFFLCWISGLLIGANWGSYMPVIGCPPDWTQLDARCFMFHNRHVVMAEAESICIALGGNLVSIHNEDELLFVRELIYKESGHYPRTWIGCHDGVKEGVWMWTDGSGFDYSSWAAREPNNNRGEHCVEMNFAGVHWNDIPCINYPRPFVCAKDL